MNSLLQQSRAIIFDVDGLLIDSEALWDRAREVYAKKYGKVFPQSEQIRLRGMGMKEVAQAIGDIVGIDEKVETIMQQFRNTFYDLAVEQHQLHLMPGVRELLQMLVIHKKQLAIATGGHSKEKMLEILQVLGLSEFSVVISSDQVQNGKPAPDVFLFTANELGIPKEECVILEDAVNGVEAAKNARMKVIAVQKDPEMREKIKKLKPDLLVESLEELL